MTVRKLGIIPGDPYPQLHLDVDGVDVYLMPDQQKRQILDSGFVYLGPEFESRMPILHFPARRPRVALSGFTDDAEVVRLFREFLASIA